MATVKKCTFSQMYETMDYGIVFESSEVAKMYIEQHCGKLRPLVCGQECDYTSESEEKKVLNPCTGEELCSVCTVKKEKVLEENIRQQNVENTWANIHCQDRAQLLHSAADCIEKNVQLVALLESLSTGKLFQHVVDIHVPLLVKCLRHAADDSLLRENILEVSIPRGLIKVNLGGNIPFLSSFWQIAAIIASGNSVILGIYPENHFVTPYLIADLFKKAGIPNGVFNIVPYHKPAMPVFGTFTLQPHDQRTTVIVLESADLHSAADSTLTTFASSIYGVRLLVQESTYGKFLSIIQEKFAKLKVGSSVDKNADVTPIFCSKSLLEEWRKVLQKTTEQGAKVLELEAFGIPSTCNYQRPVLISGIQTTSPVMEKQFPGHTLLVLPFRTAKEAIAMGNHTEPGGEAVVWTERSALALEVAQQLKASSICINGTNNLVDVRFLAQKEMLQRLCLNFLKPVPESMTENLPGSTFEQNTPNHLYYDGKCHIVRSEDPAIMGKGLTNAVSAARLAHTRWSKMPGSSRATILSRIANCLKLKKDEFIKILSLNIPNPEEEFEASIKSLNQWAAQCRRSICGDIVNINLGDMVTVIRESVGVIGIVCPKNNPLLSFITLMAAALSYGNCVLTVLEKDYTTLAMHLFQVFDDASVPPAVVNVLTCYGGLAMQHLLPENSNLGRLWTNFKNSIHYDLQQYHLRVEYNFSKVEFHDIVPLLQCAATTAKIICMPTGDTFAN